MWQWRWKLLRLVSRLKENPLGDWPQSFNAKKWDALLCQLEDAVPKNLEYFVTWQKKFSEIALDFVFTSFLSKALSIPTFDFDYQTNFLYKT